MPGFPSAATGDATAECVRIPRAAHDALRALVAAVAPSPRFLYHGHGGHPPLVLSDEEHDPATPEGRRAICRLMAQAECAPGDPACEGAQLRRLRARAAYLEARIETFERLAVGALLSRPPIATDPAIWEGCPGEAAPSRCGQR
jgi:hypothetical protein